MNIRKNRSLDLIICTGREWENAENRKEKTSSIGEEVTDTILTKGLEKLPYYLGYSTDQSIIIGGHRISREGLETVFYGETMASSRYGHIGTYIDIDCFYKNGNWVCFSVCLYGTKQEEKERTEAFKKAIQKFDTTIPIYPQMYWEASFPMICPYQKYFSKQPSVNRQGMDQLPDLYKENPSWEAHCKSRATWDGFYEIELFIIGTGRTWILYLLWLMVMIAAFLAMLVTFWGAIVFFAGLFYYYHFFCKPAHLLAVKAAKQLNYL